MDRKLLYAPLLMCRNGAVASRWPTKYSRGLCSPRAYSHAFQSFDQRK